MIALLIVAAASANNYRVTSTSDGAPAACTFVSGVDYDCATLRDAVAAANAASGADLITFSLGGGPATITLTRTGSGEDANSTGDLDITEAVTINGPHWMYPLVIDAAGLDRAFDVHSTAGVVKFNEIEITGGLTAAAGGCVRSLSDVEFRVASVHGCTATAGGGGGAYVHRNVQVYDSSFDDNVAVSGGAIQAVGNVIVELTTFEENVASGGDGGAIWTSGNSISLDWGIFVSNWADVSGGALYVDPTSTATITMIESVLRSNGAADGYGGGLDVQDSEVSIERVEVARNQALFAGAMHFTNSQVYVSDTTISYNATVGIPNPTFYGDDVTAAIHFGGDDPDDEGYDESTSEFECESCTMVCNPIGSQENSWEPGTFLESTWGDASWEYIDGQGCPTSTAIGYIPSAPANAAYLTIHNTLVNDNCGDGMSSTGNNVVLNSACNNHATDITSTDANKHYTLASNLSAAPGMTHRIKKPYAAHNGAACMPSPDLDGRRKGRGPTAAPSNADWGCDVGAFELTMSEHTDGVY
jgi:hypothetical protein